MIEIPTEDDYELIGLTVATTASSEYRAALARVTAAAHALKTMIRSRDRWRWRARDSDNVVVRLQREVRECLMSVRHDTGAQVRYQAQIAALQEEMRKLEDGLERAEEMNHDKERSKDPRGLEADKLRERIKELKSHDDQLGEQAAHWKSEAEDCLGKADNEREALGRQKIITRETLARLGYLTQCLNQSHDFKNSNDRGIHGKATCKHCWALWMGGLQTCQHRISFDDDALGISCSQCSSRWTLDGIDYGVSRDDLAEINGKLKAKVEQLAAENLELTKQREYSTERHRLDMIQQDTDQKYIGKLQTLKRSLEKDSVCYHDWFESNTCAKCGQLRKINECGDAIVTSVTIEESDEPKPKEKERSGSGGADAPVPGVQAGVGPAVPQQPGRPEEAAREEDAPGLAVGRGEIVSAGEIRWKVNGSWRSLYPCRRCSCLMTDHVELCGRCE